jgi:hypothetical protein
MSNEDLKATLAALEWVRVNILPYPEKAKAFLVEGGFITPNGELTEPYRQDA